MARYQPSSKRSRKRILLPGQALSFALGSRARNHQDSMVGAVVLRPQAITRGTPRWNTLGREHDAVRSTRGSLPKKGWSRTSTPCTRSARRVDRKSTRLNSSHSQISYAVFCLKKKKKEINIEKTVKKKTFKTE